MVQVEDATSRIAIASESVFGEYYCANPRRFGNFFYSANAGVNIRVCDIYFDKNEKYFLQQILAVAMIGRITCCL